MPRPNGRDPETDPAAYLGKQLKKARVDAGYASQDALAAALGFERSTITKAESGARPPTDDVCAADGDRGGSDDRQAGAGKKGGDRIRSGQAGCAPARPVAGSHLGGGGAMEEPLDPRWRKASYSGNGGGSCVEAGNVAGGVLVRDTTDRDGAVLSIPAGAWKRFTAALQ